MPAIRLLLDEDVRPLLAELLSERGYEATSVAALGLRAAGDAQVLQRAIDDHRALLTHNVEHFVAMAAEFAGRGWEHHGIIVSGQLPVGELLARALRLLARKQAEDLMNSVEWLHNYR